MALITFLSGAPGSGKSTWAKRHQEMTTAANEGKPMVFVLSRDKFRDIMRATVGVENYFPVSTPMEFDLWSRYVVSFIDWIDDSAEIIIDQTNTNQKGFKRMLKYIQEHSDSAKEGKLKYRIVNFKTPYPLCLANNHRREGRAYVPDNVIKDMYDKHQTFLKEQLLRIGVIGEYNVEIEEALANGESKCCIYK